MQQVGDYIAAHMTLFHPVFLGLKPPFRRASAPCKRKEDDLITLGLGVCQTSQVMEKEKKLSAARRVDARWNGFSVQIAGQDGGQRR